MLCPNPSSGATKCVYLDSHLHIALGGILWQLRSVWGRVRSHVSFD